MTEITNSYNFKTTVVYITALLCTFVLSFLIFPFVTNAQFQQNQLTEQFSFVVSPKTPEPGESVTITARSFSFDTDRSYFTWTKNGVTIGQGTGKKQVVFQVGQAGSRALIRVSIQTPDRDSFVREITIRPASVDLIWEARTYTPAFYKGKALASSQSSVIIVAMPELVSSNGRKIAAENLIYTWKTGSRVLGSMSGRGKRSITLTSASFFNSLNISVSVSSIDLSLTAEKGVRIKSGEQYVLVYEDHPTKGILLNRAIDNSFDLKDEEVSFTAMPFFFTGNSRGDSGLTYVWKINGKKTDSLGEDPSLITLRPVSGGGEARIDLTINNVNSLLQQARTKFSLYFNEPSQNSVF